ncbi:MAG: glycosyltransferase [Bacteroidales bacterium]|nr:glycosyltransferase [Bacteroidales bacterium]
MDLSIIIPVFNRPSEVEELLESLTKQTKTEFEVIIVEDGSTLTCESIVAKYKQFLNIKYFFKSNSGPGQSRNYGAERASGNYFIFLDSDCIIPPHYAETVLSALNNNFIDAFGGPDKAHENFTILQKAINYAMTSFLTTGGIRGGSEKMDKFYPRSFNMGYSKEVFKTTGGFSKMRFGEDIDMSIRILSNAFKTRLIKDAYVFHKRRTNLKQFFKQVHNSGIARINLYKKHKNSLKAVHTLPAIFCAGSLLLIVLSIFISFLFITPIILFALLLFADASIKNKNLLIGFYSIFAAFFQLTGYGSGFLIAFWKRIVLGKDEFSAFKNTFYK